MPVHAPEGHRTLHDTMLERSSCAQSDGRQYGDGFFWSFACRVVFVCLLGGFGCQRASVSRPASEAGGKSSTSATTAGNAADLQAPTKPPQVRIVGSRTSIPADDPVAQGWGTEVIAAQAGQQLKKLGAYLPSKLGGTPSVDKLKALVTPNFRSENLRPNRLKEVFSGNALVVRRSESEANRKIQTGAQGLADTLADLSNAIGETRHAHTKFKVFRVDVSNQTDAVTDVYFQFGATTANGSHQIQATWRCNWIKAAQLQLRSIEILDYEETVGKSAAPMFADCTESVLPLPAYREHLRYGIDHWLATVETRHGINIGGWQGVSVGDLDGDGLDDLYVSQPGGLPNRMFIQNRDGTCRETSSEAGVDFLDSTRGSLIVDLDNDGDQDLALSTRDGVMIMANDGRGNFTPRAQRITPSGIPYSLAAADHDNDGDLDLFVCCYNARAGIAQHTLFARPVPYHDANNGARNVLLRNDATPQNEPWQFSYATRASGLDQNNFRFSYAAAWEDFDDDGDQDLYVANDFGRNNLYRNEGGRFVDVASTANAEDISPGMSACWGDYNNDGRMDLYVSNMFSSAGNRITFQDQFMDQVVAATKLEFQRHARGNTLLQNLGDGKFRDVSQSQAVTLGRWAWGSKFVDINNDGFQDLLVTNGFVTQEDTGDL